MCEHLRRILESKRAFRSRFAARPFAEKIPLLEKRRQRALGFAASRGKGREGQS